MTIDTFAIDTIERYPNLAKNKIPFINTEVNSNEIRILKAITKQVFHQTKITENIHLITYMKQQQLLETINFLQAEGITNPEIGIVLGTGLGKLVNEISIEKEIPYSNIPNFPVATVEFHSGKLIYGELSGKKVLVMAGRFHLYEGYNAWEVTYGIRTLHGLGIKNLLISNAAGAINLSYKKGDLMLIEDHINLQGSSPLAFKGANAFGNIFADMLEPYSKEINTKMLTVAKKQNIQLHTGIYTSVLGPQLETRAEYRMLQIFETDAVGMSTVPEVIVAKQLNLPCAAISVLTDECDPKNLQPVDIAEIIAIAGKAEPKMIALFKGVIEML